MALPEIKHCLICEELRVERGGLALILGFYGIAPDVEVLVRDFNLPIERLCFLLLAKKGGEPGSANLSAKILDGSGNDVVKFDGIHWEVRDETKKSFNLALAVTGQKFPGPGTYTFKILFNARPIYETTFMVNQGRPEDFI